MITLILENLKKPLNYHSARPYNEKDFFSSNCNTSIHNIRPIYLYKMEKQLKKNKKQQRKKQF